MPDPQTLTQFGAALHALLRTGRTDPPPAGNLHHIATEWVGTRVEMMAFGTGADEEIRTACTALDLSPIFVDALLSSYDGVSERCAALSPDLPFARDALPSWRVKDVAATMLLGGKPSLCPFTGARVLLRDTIDAHTFLHRHDGRACVVLPDWRIDQFAADRAWFFPEQHLILCSVPGYDARQPLIRTAARVMAHHERVAAYLADPTRTVMVSEESMHHIGHYIWNVASGWASLFARAPAERIGILTSAAGWQIFGGVTELYAEHAARAGVVLRPGSLDEVFDLMLDRRAIALLLSDGHVTRDAARRIVDWSRRRCDAAFLDRVAALRRDASPLVMITIRTDNRAWVEQEAGYAALIHALAAEHPRLGIVIDGINTGMEQLGTHGLMSLDDERAIGAGIVAACPGVAIFDSLGCLPHESIVLADAIDAFVAPIGAGLAKTRWVANKPGVGFSNRTFMQPGNHGGFLYNYHFDEPTPMRYVDQADITDVDEARHGETARANFSMSWRAPFEQLRTLLQAL